MKRIQELQKKAAYEKITLRTPKICSSKLDLFHHPGPGKPQYSRRGKGSSDLQGRMPSSVSSVSHILLRLFLHHQAGTVVPIPSSVSQSLLLVLSVSEVGKGVLQLILPYIPLTYCWHLFAAAGLTCYWPLQSVAK